MGSLLRIGRGIGDPAECSSKKYLKKRGCIPEHNSRKNDTGRKAEHQLNTYRSVVLLQHCIELQITWMPLQ